MVRVCPLLVMRNIYEPIALLERSASQVILVPALVPVQFVAVVTLLASIISTDVWQLLAELEQGRLCPVISNE